MPLLAAPAQAALPAPEPMNPEPPEPAGEADRSSTDGIEERNPDETYDPRESVNAWPSAFSFSTE